MEITYTEKDLNVQTAIDFANYIISKLKGTDDTLKTSTFNVLFFANGFYNLLSSALLFDDEFEVWPHGLVLPSIYHNWPPKSESKLIVADKLFIDAVLELYSGWSASELNNLLHGMTWNQAHDMHEAPQKMNSAQIANEFKTNEQLKLQCTQLLVIYERNINNYTATIHALPIPTINWV